MSLLRFFALGSPLLLLVACQSRSFNSTELNTAPKAETSAGQRLAVTFSDLNPESAHAKVEASFAAIALAAASDETAKAEAKKSIPASDCLLSDGKIIPNNEADVTYDMSQVFYCTKGVAKPASENRFLTELLLEAGSTNEEIKNVKVYFVPLRIANAWASALKSGTGHIVVYQGLMQAIIGNKAIKDDGALAGVLVHELGHIIDSRKSGFNNLNDRQNSLKEFCEIYIGKAQTAEETEAKKNTCFLRIQALTRSYEHNADNNVPVTFKRKLPELSLNPYFLADYFSSPFFQRYNPENSHPVGNERSFYLRKALKEAGIPENIPARDSTVKALVNSRAD